MNARGRRIDVRTTPIEGRAWWTHIESPSPLQKQAFITSSAVRILFRQRDYHALGEVSPKAATFIPVSDGRDELLPRCKYLVLLPLFLAADDHTSPLCGRCRVLTQCPSTCPRRQLSQPNPQSRKLDQRKRNTGSWESERCSTERHCRWRRVPTMGGGEEARHPRDRAIVRYTGESSPDGNSRSRYWHSPAKFSYRSTAIIIAISLRRSKD